jgi:hypothetical protein
MKIIPLDDLEMFELLQAAYPDNFPNDDDATFDAAIQFANELYGFDELADLLGRVVMLTMPMRSGMTGRYSHCLGKITAKEGGVNMMAVVRRDFQEPQE